MATDTLQRDQIPAAVGQILASQPITDLHTHLFAPAFGSPVPTAKGHTDPAGLLLWGIDELVTYHYLVAEVFRVFPPSKLPYENFFKLTKSQQAEHIWHQLFVERTPISEACRGVVTTLQKLGLDPNEKSLDPYRKFFTQQDASKYIDKVMEISKVKSITMTNEVFDDNEHARWMKDPSALADPRFRAVLRIDALLVDYPSAARRISQWGYTLGPEMGPRTIDDAKRFLTDWIKRMKAIYIAASLPPEFRYPAAPSDVNNAYTQTMLDKVVLPVCAEHGLPFAMMVGCRRQVNPALRVAGDMVAQSDVLSVVNLCAKYPNNKFMVTMLSRENQHELCIAARKFSNLLLFGCWWFLNNPSLIEEIERMRFELLGTSFVPQHSDARVLDQLIYKWEHSRKIIGKVLADKYSDLADSGWRVTRSQIERDAGLLFEKNFEEFLTR